jgi:hypothetical protein
MTTRSSVVRADLARLIQIRSIDEVLSEAGNYATVRELYIHAYDMCVPILGTEHPRIIDLQDRIKILPDALPIHTNEITERPNRVQDDMHPIMDNAAFAIFQSPAQRAQIDQLRALLTGESNLIVAVAQTLDAAITSTAEVLILVLTTDRTIALTEEDLQAVGDRYWKLKVTNFDREHTAT